jgi:hypothetical protein
VLQAFQTGAPGGITTSRRLAVLPDAGTIDRLFVNSVAPGTAASGKKYDYTMLVSGSASSITAQILDAATSANDTSNTASVVAGDYINFQGTPTNTPTTSDAGFGLRYVPSTAGRYSFVNSNGFGPSGAAVNYAGLTGNVGSTEANIQAITHSQTFEKLQVKINGAPGSAGSGKKWTITLRINGADKALTCDIVETATTCSATGSVAANDNDLVDFSVTPTNSPSATQMGFGVLATR